MISHYHHLLLNNIFPRLYHILTFPCSGPLKICTIDRCDGCMGVRGSKRKLRRNMLKNICNDLCKLIYVTCICSLNLSVCARNDPDLKGVIIFAGRFAEIYTLYVTCIIYVHYTYLSVLINYTDFKIRNYFRWKICRNQNAFI